MRHCCSPEGAPAQSRAPRPTRALVVAAAAVAAAVAGAGCDGSYQQFLGAVPQPPRAPDSPAEVLLGIDGLSREAFDLARARGAFAGWNAADLVTAFPGTSDYAWTRTLRAEPLDGYEIEFYDPAANEVKNAGLAGVAAHPLREGIAGTYPCYRRFDFLGDGETWQPGAYLDPLGALNATLDELFDTVAGRARTVGQVLAYVITVDVVSHMNGIEQAVAALMEIDRRIREFHASQSQRYRFTVLSDHGNAHLTSALVDPRAVLRRVGVAAVDRLTTGGEGAPLEAVPIVHTRVNYVALHAHASRVAEIAARSSLDPAVDLAVAPLPPTAAPQSAAVPAAATGGSRYGVWRQGELFAFARADDGGITVDEPDRWRWLDADLDAFVGDDGRAHLADREAFEVTRQGPYPDIFYRVATAFTHPAARHAADLLWSMPDDVASLGFEVPGAADIRANSGFHGSLSRRATLSVLASEARVLPPAVRSDELADMFPALRGERTR